MVELNGVDEGNARELELLRKRLEARRLQDQQDALQRQVCMLV